MPHPMPYKSASNPGRDLKLPPEQTNEEQERQGRMKNLVENRRQGAVGTNPSDEIAAGSTAGMTREKRVAVDSLTEKKLLGELGQLSQQSR